MKVFIGSIWLLYVYNVIPKRMRFILKKKNKQKNHRKLPKLPTTKNISALKRIHCEKLAKKNALKNCQYAHTSKHRNTFILYTYAESYSKNTRSMWKKAIKLVTI